MKMNCCQVGTSGAENCHAYSKKKCLPNLGPYEGKKRPSLGLKMP